MTIMNILHLVFFNLLSAPASCGSKRGRGASKSWREGGAGVCCSWWAGGDGGGGVGGGGDGGDGDVDEEENLKITYF